MINGLIRFNSLAMAEGSFSFLGVNIQLRGKAAFVDTKTGKTHGSTESNAGWSKETFAALDQLRACMERDLARVHFSESSESSGILGTPHAEPPSGIGENLRGGGEAPQL